MALLGLVVGKCKKVTTHKITIHKSLLPNIIHTTYKMGHESYHTVFWVVGALTSAKR